MAQSTNDPTEQELAIAKAKFDEASRRYDLGEYSAALVGFREAYLISGETGLLLNMGQCYRYLKQYDEAQKVYESYLRANPESEYRADVEKLIAQMKDLQSTDPLTPDKPKEPKTNIQIKPQWYYYGASGAAVSLGIFLGGKALNSALNARENAALNEALAQTQFTDARVFGIVADVFLVGGVVSAYLGHRKAGEP